MRFRKIVLTAAVFVWVFAAPAFALTTLKGEEARKYIGDAKSHFLSKTYTYDVLTRSHRDPMHGRFSDGVIFNPDGGRFGSLRRKVGNHILVIDAPDGREKEPVSEEAWRRQIANVLSDDNPDPIVFLDDAQKELAVVYIGRGTNVTGQMNSDGLLQINLNVPGQDSNNTFRRHR